MFIWYLAYCESGLTLLQNGIVLTGVHGDDHYSEGELVAQENCPQGYCQRDLFRHVFGDNIQKLANISLGRDDSKFDV